MASQTTVFQKCLRKHLLVVEVMERGLQNLIFDLEYCIKVPSLTLSVVHTTAKQAKWLHCSLFP